MSEKLSDKFEFRTIKVEETDQAIAIEHICFPPNEADLPENMAARIKAASNLFWVAVDKKTGKLAGFLNGLATDESRFRDEFFKDSSLYQAEGKNVMLLGLDILPDYRRQGLAREIVRQYCQREKSNGRSMLYLTCLPEKIDMYIKFGFKNNGISDSTLGGEVWYEMTYNLQVESVG